MSALHHSKHSISVEEYLAGEQHSELRHEYIDGQVYAMTGASRPHGLIASALVFALTPSVRRKGCQLFMADMKLRLEIGGKTVFYYPDLLLTCDPQDRELYFCSAPCLIVEILSESTARVDLREKLLAYQTLPSLQTYVLLEQDSMRAEVYQRAANWQVEYVEQGAIRIDCLDMDLPLADVYADVQV